MGKYEQDLSRELVTLTDPGRLKMITILEWFNALVTYLMTFSFQVICKIRLGQASRALPLSLPSKSKILVLQL